MIELTKLNKKNFMLNCDHIETLESTPDTIITLTNGKIYISVESPAEILNKIVEYKRSIYLKDIAGERININNKKPEQEV